MQKTEVPGTATVTDDDDECDDNASILDAVTNESSAVEVVEDDSVSSDSDWGRLVCSSSALSAVASCSCPSISRAGVTGSGSSGMGGRRCFPGRAENRTHSVSEIGDRRYETRIGEVILTTRIGEHELLLSPGRNLGLEQGIGRHEGALDVLRQVFQRHRVHPG